MAANQNGTKKFRILKSEVVSSKVISNVIIKCVSNSVVVKEEETVFAEEVHATKPETYTPALESAVAAPNPGIESKADDAAKTENSDEKAAQPGTEKPHIRRRKTIDDAATKIQALERQRQSKKKVKMMQETMEQQEKERTRAATLIQNVQRRKSAMKKYDTLRSEKGEQALSVSEVTHALHDLLALGDPEELHANQTFANLISAKADIDMESEDGYTAIALACYYQGEDVVSRLIELNANLSATGPQGDTLLIAATTRTPCEPEIITLLLDYPEIRGKINVCENNYQTSALFLLCQEYDATHANHTRCEDALKVMLKVKGVDVDITNSAGVTPLMMAVSNGSHNVAQILMDAGADPNKQDNRGNSALAIAGVGEDDLMWQILGGEFDD